ncbi:MAG: methionyl-tRNA formyltransferase [Haloplasmataceae bacterium]|nr:methionyl-tRNA formyltransferase [Haloplasmataceae bacterium]
MRIVFMGTPEFSLNVLQALIDSEHEVVGVVTQPDRKVGRKQIVTAPPVKQLAQKFEIPTFQPEKIKLEYEQVINWQPDIIITCAFGQIIPKVLLDYPKFGAINVHASLLPNYRGGAPIHKAIMDGEKTTGITIMYMSPKMDAGDIISQREMSIEYKDDVLSMHQKLSTMGAELLMETLPSIINGTNNRSTQDEAKATYAYNIKPVDELIDWSRDGSDIYNQIRGLYPWPVAYTMYQGKRIKICKAEEVVRIHNTGAGEIIRVYTDAILVTTGDEVCIKIMEVQMEGKTKQHMKDILNGNQPFEIGKLFE